MTDKCTSPEGHKFGITNDCQTIMCWCERCEYSTLEAADVEAMLNEHPSLTEKVEIEHEQVCQFIRDMYTGRFAEREEYYFELPQWIRDAIEADPIYNTAEEQEDE